MKHEKQLFGMCLTIHLTYLKWPNNQGNNAHQNAKQTNTKST